MTVKQQIKKDLETLSKRTGLDLDQSVQAFGSQGRPGYRLVMGGGGVELSKRMTRGEFATMLDAMERMTFRSQELASVVDALNRLADNICFDGAALRTAKGLVKTADERSVLDRYLTGRQTSTDHLTLQEIANSLRSR